MNSRGRFAGFVIGCELGPDVPVHSKGFPRPALPTQCIGAIEFLPGGDGVPHPFACGRLVQLEPGNGVWRRTRRSNCTVIGTAPGDGIEDQQNGHARQTGRTDAQQCGG
jgi:hypothetical protein